MTTKNEPMADPKQAEKILERDRRARVSAFLREMKSLQEKFECDLIPKIEVVGVNIKASFVINPRRLSQ